MTVVQLPDDYLEVSVQISAGMTRIDLHALHLLDIVARRIERLSETDMRDIKVCIKQLTVCVL